MAPRRGTRLEEVLYSDDEGRDLERGGAETSYRNPLAAGAVQAQVRADGCSVWEPWQDTNAWCRVVSPFPGTFLAVGCQGALGGPHDARRDYGAREGWLGWRRPERITVEEL